MDVRVRPFPWVSPWIWSLKVDVRGLWYRLSGSLKTIVKGRWKPASGVGPSRLVQDKEYVCQGSLCTVYVYRGVPLLRCRGAYFSVGGMGGNNLIFKKWKIHKKASFLFFLIIFTPQKIYFPQFTEYIHYKNAYIISGETMIFLIGGGMIFRYIFRNMLM